METQKEPRKRFHCGNVSQVIKDCGLKKSSKKDKGKREAWTCFKGNRKGYLDCDCPEGNKSKSK